MHKFREPIFSISPQNNTDISGIIRNNPTILVDAYASSVFDNSYSSRGPHYVTDHTTTSSWASEDTENQWIVVRFAAHEIHITNYSVQSADFVTGTSHARMWKVEGLFIDQWILIDEVTSSKINGRFLIETRSVSNTGPFTAFRFISTGISWSSSQTKILRFCNIDFFGMVYLLNCFSLKHNNYLAYIINSMKMIIFTSIFIITT